MPNYVICEISKDPKPCVNAVVICNNITYITLWDFIQKSFVIWVFLICFVQLICKIKSYSIINNRESEKKQKPIDYYIQLFYFLYLSFDLLIFETILKNLFLHLIFLQELKFINKSVKYYNLQKINDFLNLIDVINFKGFEHILIRNIWCSIWLVLSSLLLID